MTKERVKELFLELEELDLLEDRAEYDAEDFKVAYPYLGVEEVTVLYLLVTLWRKGDKSAKEIVSIYLPGA